MAEPLKPPDSSRPSSSGSARRRAVQRLLVGVAAVTLAATVSVRADWIAYNNNTVADGGYRVEADNAEWMGSLPDFLSVAELSVPGTHDSGAWQVQTGADTQGLRLADQLASGVRAWDIRVKQFSDRCYPPFSLVPPEELCLGLNDAVYDSQRVEEIWGVFHGPIWLQYDDPVTGRQGRNMRFSDVLNEARRFLAAHPSETILMRLKDEAGNVDEFVELQRDILNRYIAHYEDPPGSLFWTCPNDRGESECIPTLGDVRGRIVVMSQFVNDGGLTVGLDYEDPDIVRIQDKFAICDYPVGEELSHKLAEVQHHLYRTNTETIDRLWINYSSATGIAGAGTCGLNPRAIASWINPRVEAQLLDRRAFFNCGLSGCDIVPIDRTGLLYTDFPGGGLINQTIASNWHLYSDIDDIDRDLDQSFWTWVHGAIEIAEDASSGEGKAQLINQALYTALQRALPPVPHRGVLGVLTARTNQDWVYGFAPVGTLYSDSGSIEGFRSVAFTTGTYSGGADSADLQTHLAMFSLGSTNPVEPAIFRGTRLRDHFQAAYPGSGVGWLVKRQPFDTQNLHLDVEGPQARISIHGYLHVVWLFDAEPMIVPVHDVDSDGVFNHEDNCPETPNPDQRNNDGDAAGDACDDDDDNDGHPDVLDNCPLDINFSQADLDGDGRGDICDSDIDGDGISNEDERVAGTDPRDPDDPAPPPPVNRPPVFRAFFPVLFSSSGPREEGVVLRGSAFATDPGDPVSYFWDLDNDEIYETPGQFIEIDTARINGTEAGTELLIAVVACDDENLCSRPERRRLEIFNAIPRLRPLRDQSVFEGELPPYQALDIVDPGLLDTHVINIDWGDGQTETITTADRQVLVQHLYPDPGDYAVTLTVTDSDGGRSVSGYSVEVRDRLPDLRVPESVEIGEGSRAVINATLIDATAADVHAVEARWADGRRESFLLEAGETSFTLTSPVYPDQTTDSVEISVTDDEGNRADATVQITIENVAPTVRQVDGLPFLSLYEEGDTVVVDMTVDDPGLQDTLTATIDWVFEDVSETIELPPGHSRISFSRVVPDGYPTYGAWPRVTVVDKDGAEDRASHPMYAANVAPAVTVSAGAAIDEGETAVINATLIDPGILDTHAVQVAWGDGRTDAFSLAAGTDSFSASHHYADDDPSGSSADDYEVSVQVIDKDGGRGSGSSFVTVRNVPPQLQAPGDRTIPEGTGIGLISFDDPGLDDTFQARIDWGDGQIEIVDAAAGDGIGAAHVYANEGVYPVTVTVTDDDQGEDVRVFEVEVINIAPVVSLLPSPSISEGGQATVTGSILDPGVNDSFAVTVTWSDGSTETITLSPGSTEFSLTSSPLLDDTTLLAQVEVSDDGGGLWSGELTVPVFNLPPAVTLSSPASEIAEGQAAILRGTVTDPGVSDQHTVSVEWAAGTSETLSLPPGTHEFELRHVYLEDSGGGQFAPLVRVSDDDGGHWEAPYRFTVRNVAPTLAPMAAQSGVEGEVAAGAPIAITDPGSLDSFRVLIDWGDGQTETITMAPRSLSPTHRYRDDGVYTVTVTVIDDDAGRDSGSFEFRVENRPPSARIRLAGPPVIGGRAVILGTLENVAADETVVATVDWGDGQSTRQVLTGESTNFSLASAPLTEFSSRYAKVILTDEAGATWSGSIYIEVGRRSFSGQFRRDQISGPLH